jgi:hypothetical protein
MKYDDTIAEVSDKDEWNDAHDEMGKVMSMMIEHDIIELNLLGHSPV